MVNLLFLITLIKSQKMCSNSSCHEYTLDMRIFKKTMNSHSQHSYNFPGVNFQLIIIRKNHPNSNEFVPEFHYSGHSNAYRRTLYVSGLFIQDVSRGFQMFRKFQNHIFFQIFTET